MTTLSRHSLDLATATGDEILRGVGLGSHAGTAARRGLHLCSARNAADWDAALSAAGVEVTAFHRWSWLRGQADLQGWRFEPLLVRRGSQTVGAVPLLLRRRGPGWLSVSTPFIYTGPAVSPEDLPDTLDALRGWARLHRVFVTRLDFTPATSPAVRSALATDGCELSEETTYVLDLDGGVDAVRSRMSRSVRKSLQSAAKAGVTCSPSTRNELVELLPTLLHEAFTVRGLARPYPDGIGAWAWDQLSAIRSVMMTAHVDGRPVGLLTGIGDGPVLYGWAGGALREVRHLRVSHALHVAVFDAATVGGYQCVDTLGAVDEGVSHFKASFGARPQPFLIAQQTAYRSYATLRSWRRQRDLFPVS